MVIKRNLARFLQPPTPREQLALAGFEPIKAPVAGAIKTGCWFSPLPADHVQIGISVYAPKHIQHPLSYRPLAPGRAAWAARGDDAAFCTHYAAQLAALDTSRVHDELLALAAGKVAVLCCWERAGAGGRSWCHRSLVSQWFAETLGLVVSELGHEHDRIHPLSPPTVT
jgi:hypothetical protein